MGLFVCFKLTENNTDKFFFHLRGFSKRLAHTTCLFEPRSSLLNNCNTAEPHGLFCKALEIYFLWLQPIRS